MLISLDEGNPVGQNEMIDVPPAFLRKELDKLKQALDAEKAEVGVQAATSGEAAELSDESKINRKVEELEPRDMEERKLAAAEDGDPEDLLKADAQALAKRVEELRKLEVHRSYAPACILPWPMKNACADHGPTTSLSQSSTQPSRRPPPRILFLALPEEVPTRSRPKLP